MYNYIRMIDWQTEFRAGRTIYEVRHAVRNTRSGNVEIIRTYHPDPRPTKAQAESAGQSYVDRLNTRIQQEQNRARLDMQHLDQIKEQLQELVALGVSPTQISSRLNTLIANVKADNGIT